MSEQTVQLGCTKAELDAMLKDIFGSVAAEMREANEALGKAIMEGKAKPPGFVGAETAVARTFPPMKKGGAFGRIVAAAVHGKITGGGSAEALAYATKNWGEGPEMDVVIKGLQAGDFTAGGVLLGAPISNDFIELLRPAVVVRSLDPDFIPMPEGAISIRKETGDVTSTYRGENVAVNSSEPDYGWVHLAAKELITKAAISNKLIRYSPLDVEARVTATAISSMSRREDLAFIRGDGLSNTPKGLRNLIAAANATAANGTINHQNIVTDFGKLELLLANANVPQVRPAYIWAPRTEIYLMNLVTADGNYAFRAEMLAGTLNAKRFRRTTQVPVNLGDTANQSEVYLVEMSEVLLGDTMQMNVAVTTEGSYKDASGVVQSAWDNDETVVRIITEHDIGLKHDQAVAVLTGVKWGV